MVSAVSTPQCGQRMVASVTGSAMEGIYGHWGDRGRWQLAQEFDAG
jgi:hypothetical protein